MNPTQPGTRTKRWGRALRGLWGGIWEGVTTPGLLPLWIGLFAWCTLMASMNEASIARWIIPIGSATRCITGLPLVNIYNDNGSLVAAIESTEENSDLMGRARLVAGVWHIHVPPREYGLWGPTRSTGYTSLTVSFIDPPSPEHGFDEATVRALAFDQFDASGEVGRLNPILRTRNLTESRILWGGYAFNLFSLFTLVATIGSGRRWRRKRAFARALRDLGKCPSCRYPTAGLPASICPECGTTLATQG